MLGVVLEVLACADVVSPQAITVGAAPSTDFAKVRTRPRLLTGSTYVKGDLLSLIDLVRKAEKQAVVLEQYVSTLFDTCRTCTVAYLS